MPRPTDWSALDRSSDPIPGDPGIVRSYASDYQKVADAIKDAATRLNSIAGNTDHYMSEYVDKFRDKAKEVAGDISKAHERYAGVASAMTVYAGPLETAQSDSLAALTAARNASDGANSTHTQVSTYEKDLQDPSMSENDREHYTALLNNAKSENGAHAAALNKAKQDLQNAIDMRDKAANTAKDAINNVQNSGGVNDSWWDKFKHWVADHAELLNKIVSIISKVAAIMSLLAPFMSLIPGIGEIWDAITLVVDIVNIIATVAVVANAVLQAATGVENPWAAAFDIALAVVPLGAGKLLGRMGSSASEEIESTAGSTLQHSAASLGVSGFTKKVSVDIVKDEAKSIAKPTLKQALLTENPMEIARANATADLELTVKGTSDRVAQTVAEQAKTYKYGAYTRPMDVVVATGADEKAHEAIFGKGDEGGSGE